MRFSQEMGKTKIQTTIQKDEMSDSFRNRIDNLIEEIMRLWFLKIDIFGPTGFTTFHEKYCNYFGLRYSDVPTTVSGFIRQLNADSNIWNVYDFIEFLIAYKLPRINNYINLFNAIFELEKSAYRLDKNGKLIAITDEIELTELNRANDLSKPYDNVNEHLEKARSFFSNREQPDYDKTIVESIHAIEAVCKKIGGDEKATLGAVLKKMNLHKALQDSLTKLYGFSSETVRHAKKPNNAQIDENDARLILITAHSIVNYLISKNL